MPRKHAVVPARQQEADVVSKVAAKILSVLGEVPTSSERKSRNPAEAARKIASTAAVSAATAAGSLALPPGPLGWLTVLPEMVLVWKIQAQMVADIAGVYGQHHRLRREHLLYCLFKQVSATIGPTSPP